MCDSVRLLYLLTYYYDKITNSTDKPWTTHTGGKLSAAGRVHSEKIKKARSRRPVRVPHESPSPHRGEAFYINTVSSDPRGLASERSRDSSPLPDLLVVLYNEFADRTRNIRDVRAWLALLPLS